MANLKSVESKSKSKKDKDIRISIEEIENGFIITKNIEWSDPKKGWQYETKKIYSETNPLADAEETSLADAFKE